jgi:hypothetical protein
LSGPINNPLDDVSALGEHPAVAKIAQRLASSRVSADYCGSRDQLMVAQAIATNPARAYEIPRGDKLLAFNRYRPPETHSEISNMTPKNRLTELR